MSTLSHYYTTHPSRIGTLILVASARGLQRINLLSDGETTESWLKKHYGAESDSIIELKGFFTTALGAIDSYLDEGEELSLPFDLTGGTALQRMVWLAIAKIPYGTTVSYTDLATKVGFPRAVRAVASACGANPIPLVIPCHRVVAKDGTLGGFSLGGLNVKEVLLGVEKPKSAFAA